MNTYDRSLLTAPSSSEPRVFSPTDTPVSRIAVFTDPDGNHVGLVSR
jgi:hypothetical protein